MTLKVLRPKQPVCFYNTNIPVVVQDIQAKAADSVNERRELQSVKQKAISANPTLEAVSIEPRKAIFFKRSWLKYKIVHRFETLDERKFSLIKLRTFKRNSAIQQVFHTFSCDFSGPKSQTLLRNGPWGPFLVSPGKFSGQKKKTLNKKFLRFETLRTDAANSSF